MKITAGVALAAAIWRVAFGVSAPTIPGQHVLDDRRRQPLSVDLTRLGHMAQTHATRGAILVLSVLSFGLLTGAMLLIGVSIVGFWKSLTPSEFVSWFASYSSRLGV